MDPASLTPTSVCPNLTNADNETVIPGTCRTGGLGLQLSTPILMMSTGVAGNLLALLVLFTADKQVCLLTVFTLSKIYIENYILVS